MTQSVSIEAQMDGVTRISAAFTETLGSLMDLDETVATGQTDKELVCRVETSGLRIFAINSDQDVTVKTNSSGSPNETWTLKRNKPLVWANNMGLGFPLLADLTSIFVTNASGSTARIQVMTGRTPTT